MMLIEFLRDLQLSLPALCDVVNAVKSRFHWKNAIASLKCFSATTCTGSYILFAMRAASSTLSVASLHVVHTIDCSANLGGANSSHSFTSDCVSSSTMSRSWLEQDEAVPRSCFGTHPTYLFRALCTLKSIVQ
eukprot:m.682978 g.682978  ORF g.682978 m.682978 type:complete len:133 (+) comp22825_c0_seq6:2108-2506(+)